MTGASPGLRHTACAYYNNSPGSKLGSCFGRVTQYTTSGDPAKLTMAFDPYETWLGIPADLRPPTYYDLLGLASHESDPVAIEQAALRRMAKVIVHQTGPHGDESQALLALLAQARQILMDPERRAEYNTRLRAGGASRPGPSEAQENVGIADAADVVIEPEIAAPDALSSLVLTDEREGDGTPALHSALEKRPSSWKRVAVFLLFLASHGLLFGAFYFFVFGSSRFKQDEPNTDQEAPESLATSDSPRPSASTFVLPERQALRTTGGVIKTDSVKAHVAAQDRPKTKSSSAQKKPDGARKKASSGGASMQFSSPPIEVKPVFFVPRGQIAPNPVEIRRLSYHLAWCQERYGEMLNGRDTFTLQKGAALIHRSRTSLDELKAAAESGAPRITGELLNATRFDRFNCPYIFVTVVMNAVDDFPAGGGRPFNGGFNTGGGIVVLSSFALGKLPNFQSTLEHEVGHAFGLPHVDVYGQNMQTSASIMSYNPAHHTREMQPSRTPGILGPEDLVGLTLNRRAFAKLAGKGDRKVTPGAARPNVVPLGPMKIDGHPAYELRIATDSGQAFGTKVSNIIQNRISPSAGGQFDPNSMWQSGKSEGGMAVVMVTFSSPVTLAAVGVHSQHSGTYNAADHVRVEAQKRDGFQPVADSPVHATDAIVPLLEQSTAKIWRLSFHAANNKEVTLRGLQFFTRNGEIFSPQVPGDGDVGFFR
jgi:curved DNA-binding protein CbpA